MNQLKLKRQCRRFGSTLALAVVVTAAGSRVALAGAGKCEELEEIPAKEAAPAELVAAANNDGQARRDAICLANVAGRELSQSHCTAARQSAARAMEIAPANPEAQLMRGLADTCLIAGEATLQGKGVPIWCDRDRMIDIVFDVTTGGMLSHLEGAEKAAVYALEQSLALACRDDDGLQLAGLSALAATSEVDSIGLSVLQEHPMRTWGLSGPMVLHNLMVYNKTSDPGAGGLSVVRAQAHELVVALARSVPGDAFLPLGPQVAATALLRADFSIQAAPSGGGYAIEDIDMLERMGALHQQFVIEAAAQTVPPWLAESPLPDSTLAELSSLAQRLVPYGSSRAGSILLLKTRFLVVVREPGSDPCAKSAALAAALTDFARTGAQMVSFEEWPAHVLRAALVGADTAMSCPNATLRLREFERIVGDLNTKTNPWPPHVMFAGNGGAP